MEVNSNTFPTNGTSLEILQSQIGTKNLPLIHFTSKKGREYGWNYAGMVFPFYAPKAMNMRNIEDFKMASFEKKCDLLIADSNYITSRKLADTKIYLYHTGEFFVEVYYSSKYKKVLMINAFDDMAGMEPYADNVSLEELAL
jgi:hypothetical protein